MRYVCFDLGIFSSSTFYDGKAAAWEFCQTIVIIQPNATPRKRTEQLPHSLPPPQKQSPKLPLPALEVRVFPTAYRVITLNKWHNYVVVRATTNPPFPSPPKLKVTLGKRAIWSYITDNFRSIFGDRSLRAMDFFRAMGYLWGRYYYSCTCTYVCMYVYKCNQRSAHIQKT